MHLRLERVKVKQTQNRVNDSVNAFFGVHPIPQLHSHKQKILAAKYISLENVNKSRQNVLSAMDRVHMYRGAL